MKSSKKILIFLIITICFICSILYNAQTNISEKIIQHSIESIEEKGLFFQAVFTPTIAPNISIFNSTNNTSNNSSNNSSINNTCILPTSNLINSSITLCGLVQVNSPIFISGNNLKITCTSGTVLQYAPSINQLVNAIVISPNSTGITLSGCIFNGKFSNAIRIISSSNIILQNNIIIGAVTGIKEEYGSVNNRYVGNIIRGAGKGFVLEGTNATIANSEIIQNSYGIITGKSTNNLLSSTPGVLCGNISNSTIRSCSFPSSGKKVEIINNTIKHNAYGITSFGLDNKIINNSIEENILGIEVNSIYAGSELNPGTSGVTAPNTNQVYFNSGISIINNKINNNKLTGIWLNGPSQFFPETSLEFSRKTIIKLNNISNNGYINQNYGEGIGIGRNDGATPENLFSWEEYTDISNNQIKNNSRDGILIQRGGIMTDIRENVISFNGRNGISLGTINPSRQNISLFPDEGKTRFIYHNKINSNNLDGIYAYNGVIDLVYLNEINQNINRGIYVPENPKGESSQIINSVICNDISYNFKEGLNYDAKQLNLSQTFEASPKVYSVTKNRFLNNGADGIRYYLDSHSNITGKILPLRTINNHFQGNGFNPNPNYNNSGYGINVDGFYYHGFFANNFIGNNKGPTYDSSSRGIENMWDEHQFELGYDNLLCKNCGGNCVSDLDCGFYSGTCVNNICHAPLNSGLSCNTTTSSYNCYSHPTNPGIWNSEYYFNYPGQYGPRGNYGLNTSPFIVPPSNTPPLFPIMCTYNQQCVTNSCEFYPTPVNKSQCGNGNFVNEPSAFTGYYQPPFATASCGTQFQYTAPTISIFSTPPPNN